MNLYRLKISGTPIADNTAYTLAETNGNNSYVAAATNPSASDYDDISSIENWDKYGSGTGKDYKFVRDEIKALVTDFSALTADEKLICCNHKVGTHAERVAVVGLDNVVLLGLLYHSKASESRTTRLGYAIAEVHNRLPDDAPQIINDARDQILDYYIFGREGTVQGDLEGITDYLNGLGSFVGIGLIDKSWTPEGVTMQQLIDKIEDILLNGNY